jgi:hypothetical protein
MRTRPNLETDLAHSKGKERIDGIGQTPSAKVFQGTRKRGSGSINSIAKIPVTKGLEIAPQNH